MSVPDCRGRGDPGLSFHKVARLASLAEAEAAAVDEQDFMRATKLKVKAAIIAQHREQAEHAAGALRGLSHVGAAEFMTHTPRSLLLCLKCKLEALRRTSINQGP